VAELHGLELVVEVGDHAARDLVLVERRVVLRHLAARLLLAQAQPAEIARNGFQHFIIE